MVAQVSAFVHKTLSGLQWRIWLTEWTPRQVWTIYFLVILSCVLSPEARDYTKNWWKRGYLHAHRDIRWSSDNPFSLRWSIERTRTYGDQHWEHFSCMLKLWQ